jgi:hypothetical protein
MDGSPLASPLGKLSRRPSSLAIFRLEQVDLAARASLQPIKTATIEKKRVPDLMAVQINSGSRHECS